jgi:FkbM family methyltransferase
MRAKQLAQSALGRAGFHLSKSPPFSTRLAQFFEAHDVDLVIDVGSHHGGYCSFLRNDAGYRGQIISFEPCKASFEILSRRMAYDPNWSGFNLGLSDKDGEATLNTYGDRGDFNSVLHLSRTATSAYGVAIASKTEIVQFKRLDNVELTKSSSIFLKLDTQGHDISVVRGGLRFP